MHNFPALLYFFIFFLCIITTSLQTVLNKVWDGIKISVYTSIVVVAIAVDCLLRR